MSDTPHAIPTSTKRFIAGLVLSVVLGAHAFAQGSTPPVASPPVGYEAFVARVGRALEAGAPDDALSAAVAAAPRHAVRLLQANLRVIASTTGAETAARAAARRAARVIERALLATGKADGVRGLVKRVAAFTPADAKRGADAGRKLIAAVKARRRGRLPDTLRLAREAAHTYDEIGRPYLAADAKRQVGEALLALRRPREGRAWFERILRETAPLHTPRFQASLHRSAAQVCEQLGLTERANAHLAAGEVLLRPIDAPVEHARLKEAKASILRRRGRVDEAARLFGEVIPLYDEKLGAHAPVAAVARMNFASCHADLGDYARAITALKGALPVLRRIGHPGAEATALNNLGNLYGLVGRRLEAIQTLTQAWRSFEALGHRRSTAAVGLNLVVLRARVGEHEEALRLLDETKSVLRTGDVSQKIRWLSLKARCLFGLGDPEAADPHLEQAVTLARRANDLQAEVNLLITVAERHRLARRHEEALAVLDRAEVLIEKLGNRDRLAHVLDHRGVVLLALRRPGAALEVLERASIVHENVGRTLKRFGDAARLERIRRAKPWVSLAAVEAAYRAGPGHAARGFSILERRSGVAMRDLLADAAIEPTPRGDATLLERRAALRRAIAVARGRNEARGAARTRTSAPSVRDRLAALDRALGRVEDRLRASDPSYASLVYPRSLDARAIIERLAPGEILVSFLATHFDAFAFVVDASGVRLLRLGPASEIERAVNMLVSALRDAPADADALARDDTWRAPAKRVSERVTHPLTPYLESARFVTIVPHGPFCFVPYDLLATKAGDTIVDRWPTRLIHSATVLDTLRRQRADAAARRAAGGERETRRTLLALGDPAVPAAAAASLDGASVRLTGAAREIDVIARGVRSNREDAITLLVGDRATESAFVAPGFAARYRAIHLACHGVADPDQPRLSGLWLAPGGWAGETDVDDGADDGFLGVRDILPLRLDADVVVLSACDSNVGRVEALDGVQSLTRAFLHAGSGSVVVSNWRVSDRSTPELMERFYRGWLREGASPIEALRRAKQAVRRGGAHPVHWAGFALWGLGR